MKVMHILNTNSYSGAESVAISIIKHMGGEIDFIYVSLDGPIRNILERNEIKFCPIEKMKILKMRNIIKREKPDIIHAHGYTTSIVASFSTGKIPIISHLHNNLPWLGKIGVKSVAFGISCIKYKKIFTVSDSIMREFVFGKVVKKKSEVIGNPVIVKEIRKKADTAERRDSFDILFLGRFTHQKNPELFLNIVEKIYKKIPDIKVGMVGKGEKYEEIQEKISDMGLEGVISCLGFINNPYGILKNSKLLCIPSRWEGFGLVAVEALSLEKPVVAANVGGLSEIITNKSGRLCNMVDEYIEEIYLLLTDESYYEKKAKGAYERGCELDNEEIYFKELKKIYESSIKK